MGACGLETGVILTVQAVEVVVEPVHKTMVNMAHTHLTLNQADNVMGYVMVKPRKPIVMHIKLLVPRIVVFGQVHQIPVVTNIVLQALSMKGL